MAGIKTEAVVLRKINFRETSVLLDLFTDHSGKIRGILKGVRKEKSRVSPLAFTPGTYIQTIIYPKWREGLTLIHGPIPLRYFGGDESRRLKLWHSMLRLVNLFAAEREKSPDIFHLLRDGGRTIQEAPFPEVVFVGMKMRLVRILGYGVELHRCVLCRSKEGAFFFSGRHGGILCARCRGRDRHSTGIPLKILDVMRYLERLPVGRMPVIRKVPAVSLEKINFYLTMTLHYHTDMRWTWWTNEKNIFRSHR